MSVEVQGIAALRRKFGLLNRAEHAAVAREMKRSLVAIERKAKGRVGRRSSQLANSITHTLDESELDGRVGTNADHALDHHFGTKPHIIRPRSKSVLAFPMGGRTVFAKKVSHPGTDANPFLFGPFEEERPAFVANTVRALNEANRRVSNT